MKYYYILFTSLLFSTSVVSKAQSIPQNGLLLDLNADRQVTTQNGNQVTRWRNQAPTNRAENFVTNDVGRANFGGPGSGRPTLIRNNPDLNGHNSIAFRDDELINFEENTFDHLTTGAGYTWVAIVAPYAQTHPPEIPLIRDVNAFFGNLRNGAPFDGLWAGFTQNRNLWTSTRNRNAGGRFLAPNDTRIGGPNVPLNQFRIVAGRLQSGVGNRTMQLFVNNENPVSSASIPVLSTGNASVMAIGTERNATNHPGRESFDGEIARFLIFERPLSNVELRNTLNSLRQTYFGTPNSNVVTLRKRNATGFGLDGGRGAANGQNVYLWNHNRNNVNQQFTEINRGNGFFSYQKVGTNFSIDGGAGGARAQNVRLWVTNPNNFNQQWRKISITGNTFRLQKRNAPNFSIDGGRGGARAQNVYLWSSTNNNQNMQWIIQ